MFVFYKVPLISINAMMLTFRGRSFLSGAWWPVTVRMVLTGFDNIGLTTSSFVETTGYQSVLDPVFPSGLWETTVTAVSANIATAG